MKSPTRTLMCSFTHIFSSSFIHTQIHIHINEDVCAHSITITGQLIMLRGHWCAHSHLCLWIVNSPLNNSNLYDIFWTDTNLHLPKMPLWTSNHHILSNITEELEALQCPSARVVWWPLTLKDKENIVNAKVHYCCVSCNPIRCFQAFTIPMDVCSKSGYTVYKYLWTNMAWFPECASTSVPSTLWVFQTLTHCMRLITSLTG